MTCALLRDGQLYTFCGRITNITSGFGALSHPMRSENLSVTPQRLKCGVASCMAKITLSKRGFWWVLMCVRRNGRQIHIKEI